MSFKEFLTSPEFCGMEGIYEFWIDAFENLIATRGLIPELILDGSLGGGKCVAGDTLVLTMGGIRRMDQLVEHREADKSVPKQVSLFVEGLIEATSHTYCSPSKKALLLTFSDGSVIKCTPHHPLKRFNGVSFDWVRADSLRPVHDFVKADYTKPEAIKQYSEGYKNGVLSTTIVLGDQLVFRDVDHIANDLVEVYGINLVKTQYGYHAADIKDPSLAYKEGLAESSYILSLPLQDQMGYVMGVLDIHALISIDCVILPGKN